MSAESDDAPWDDMEAALNAVRGVACILIEMSDNQLKDQRQKDALGYLGTRLNEHCDDALDAYRRARGWPEAKP